MTRRFRFGGFAILGLGLLAFAGCGKENGTYVLLKFIGTVAPDAPIAALDLDVTLNGKPATATFTNPQGITLPTDASLEIGSGEGLLVVSAKARSAKGQILGSGQGSGQVKRGSLLTLTVDFSPAKANDDAGAGLDGGIPDGLPSDRQGSDVGLDRIADRTADGPRDGLGAGGAGGSGGTGGQTGTGGATGTVNLVAAPVRLEFGTVPVGTKSPPQTITLTQRGTGATQALSLSVQNPLQFLLADNTCAGVSLSSGASCTFSLTFRPGSATLIRSNVQVLAAGVNVLEIPLVGEGSGTSTLELSPQGMDFGVVDIAATDLAQTFSLRNAGTAPTGALQVGFATEAPAFRIQNDACAGKVLGPGETCIFGVAFIPQVVGPASATVVVRGDPGGVSTAPISGTARRFLTVNIQITGNGKGTLKAPGMACTNNVCKALVESSSAPTGTSFTVDAVPEPGSTFGGYGEGPCGATPSCTFQVTGNIAMTARFNAGIVRFGLNVINLAGHQGVLASSDGTISCSTSCGPGMVPANTSITLTAKPMGSSTFAGWTEGPCKGIQPTCTFTLAGDTFVTATFGPQAYVFTTSTTIVPGALGGPTGADNECQRLANGAKLPGNYRAWVSTSTVMAKNRVGKGGWIRTDGRPFAASVDSAITSTNPVVYYPPRLDEAGQDLGPRNQWVATGADGEGNASPMSCKDFTSTVGDLNLGDASAGHHAWSFRVQEPGGCTGRYRLLCLRTDLEIPGIKPPSGPGKRIFVTRAPFIPTGGWSGADILCQEEAKTANLDGKFLAFLSTGNFSAMSRIGNSMGPWKRWDDVVVAETPENLGKRNLLAPPGQTADGRIYLASEIWTGSKEPNTPGAGDTSCMDYTHATDADRSYFGLSHSTASPEWFTAGLTPCSNPNAHLICIEP